MLRKRSGSVPFMITSKKKPNTNLTKGVKVLCNENYKLLKKLTKTAEDGEVSLARGLTESILGRW